MDGAISIDNPMGERLEVYDIDAAVVATADSDAVINLPAGIYVVSGTAVSQEVVIE